MTTELAKAGAKLMGGAGRNGRNDHKSYFSWGLTEATQMVTWLALGLVAFGMFLDFIKKDFGRTPRTK